MWCPRPAPSACESPTYAERAMQRCPKALRPSNVWHAGHQRSDARRAAPSRTGACTCGATSRRRRPGSSPCRAPRAPAPQPLPLSVRLPSAFRAAAAPSLCCLFSRPASASPLFEDPAVRAGSVGDACVWEVDMVPDTRKTKFSRWVGLLVHSGAAQHARMQPQAPDVRALA